MTRVGWDAWVHCISLGSETNRAVTKGGRKLVGQGNRKKRTFQEAMQTLADSSSRDIKDHNKVEES